MDEQFLYYIWKFQKFNSPILKTTDGRKLFVFNPGNHNQHSGPDFEEARIKLGKLEWAGSIEIHIRSSDWYRHNHQKDKAYNNVVLHVVWKDDRPVSIEGEPVPTLEMKSLVDPTLFEAYQKFIDTEAVIACGSQLHKISSLRFTSMLDRAMIERLERKASEIEHILKKNNTDWEATAYTSLARNMGFSVNKEPFERLTSQLPYRIITRCVNQPRSLEALCFGQAGFLEDPADPYQCELAREYNYLRKKLKLRPSLSRSMWKFGRMRPPNLPTVRLAQFTSLLSYNPHLFAKLISIDNPKDIFSAIKVELSGYWSNHYDFTKPRKIPSRSIGKATFENLIINTLAPLLAAYSRYIADQKYLDRAIALLEELPPETNRIVRLWHSLDQRPTNSFDSQALLELFSSYCSKKRCLNCNIGVELLAKQ